LEELSSIVACLASEGRAATEVRFASEGRAATEVRFPQRSKDQVRKLTQPIRRLLAFARLSERSAKRSKVSKQDYKKNVNVLTLYFNKF
jgi:hypothetical protein